jgi:hypothetical protein
MAELTLAVVGGRLRALETPRLQDCHFLAALPRKCTVAGGCAPEKSGQSEIVHS